MIPHAAIVQSEPSLIVMPLFHVHGLIGAALSTLYTGGTIIIQKKFSASSFWSEALNNNATWYSAVPTIHQILLSHFYHIVRLKLFPEFKNAPEKMMFPNEQSPNSKVLPFLLSCCQ